jgi:hypothetical protein
LGCRFYYPSDAVINVVRFPRVFAIRKMPVSVAVQRRMLGVLGFSEAEWVQALTSE